MRSVPRGGDWSGVRCLIEAIRVSMLFLGLDEACAKRVTLLIRHVLVKMALKDLSNASNAKLNKAEISLLRAASRQLAHSAGKATVVAGTKDRKLSVDKRDAWTSDTDLFNIKSTLNSVEKHLCAMEESKYCTPELVLGKSSSCEPADVTHPLFGRFRLDGFDIERLAGAAARPPILRPIELTHVPEKVETFEEVATALRRIVYACTYSVLSYHPFERTIQHFHHNRYASGKSSESCEEFILPSC